MASESSVMAVIRASCPSFRNSHDKLAFVVHSSFLAAGYSLNATGSRALSVSPSTDEEVGTEGWNELDDVYGFVYSKAEKGEKNSVLVKCLPIGDVLAVDVLDLKDSESEPFNVQINTKEYLSDLVSLKPSNYAEVYNNFNGLVEKLNSDLFAKMKPKASTSPMTRNAGQARSNVVNSAPPVVIRTQEPSRPTGVIYPPVPPAGISDLYPGPGAGFYPDRGLGVGGGMLVGPNDPRFFGSVEPPPFHGGISGVPPGARFDPYGPPGVPGFEPGPFIRQPRPPGRGAHPDAQHFPDPDYI